MAKEEYMATVDQTRLLLVCALIICLDDNLLSSSPEDAIRLVDLQP